jgi:hypothetical protein
MPIEEQVTQIENNIPGTDMMRQNPNEVKMHLSLEVGSIDIRIHKNSDNLRKNDDSQWLRLGISKIRVEINSMTFDSKIRIRLYKLRI